MKNYHEKSILISPEEISKIESALENAWSKETADATETENWTEENRALGQCAITSVIINDLFGGRMIYDKVNFHIWNELPDGSQHDFSRTQFPNGTIFSIYKHKTRDDILFDDRGKEMNILDRYKKLKESFDKSYANIRQ